MYVTTQAYLDDDETGDLTWTYSRMDGKLKHQPDTLSLYGVVRRAEKRGLDEFNCTGLDVYTEPPATVLPWEFME